MSERPKIILALTLVAERQVEDLLFDPDAPFALLSSAVEADELQRSVQEEQPQAVLVSPDLSGLTSAHCERVRTAGVRLIGLALQDRERRALNALGIDVIIEGAVSREQLLDAITGNQQQQQAEAITTPVRAPVRSDMASEHGDGSTIAVIGSKGAPGASECACSLAVLATRRWPTVLVELDGLGGGLDVRLGGDPRQGSLVGLLNATETSNGLLRELIERWLIHREDWPAVLLAPPDPNAISELATPGSVARAMQTLAGSYPVTVCDVGFLISEAELPAVRVHREALVSADAVVLVIGAREVQVSEGLRQLELLQDTLGIQAERLRIVANMIGAPGTATKNQITQTLTGCLAERGVTVDAWLAWDARALKRAQRRGTPLACARQRGGYARALTGLLDELFLPAAAGTGSPTPRRQKRRLALPTTAHREADRREEEVVLPWQQS